MCDLGTLCSRASYSHSAQSKAGLSAFTEDPSTSSKKGGERMRQGGWVEEPGCGSVPSSGHPTLAMESLRLSKSL